MKPPKPKSIIGYAVVWDGTPRSVFLTAVEIQMFVLRQLSAIKFIILNREANQ